MFAEKAPSGELAAVPTAPASGYVDLDGEETFWIPSGHIHYAPEPDAPAPDELGFAIRHFFSAHRYRDPFGHDTVVDLYPP